MGQGCHWTGPPQIDWLVGWRLWEVATSPAKKSEVPSSYQVSPWLGARRAACRNASTAAACASNLSAYGSTAARPRRSLLTCEWMACARMSTIWYVSLRSVACDEAGGAPAEIGRSSGGAQARLRGVTCDEASIGLPGAAAAKVCKLAAAAAS